MQSPNTGPGRNLCPPTPAPEPEPVLVKRKDARNYLNSMGIDSRLPRAGKRLIIAQVKSKPTYSFVMVGKDIFRLEILNPENGKWEIALL